MRSRLVPDDEAREEVAQAEDVPAQGRVHGRPTPDAGVEVLEREGSWVGLGEGVQDRVLAGGEGQFFSLVDTGAPVPEDEEVQVRESDVQTHAQHHVAAPLDLFDEVWVLHFGQVGVSGNPEPDRDEPSLDAHEGSPGTHNPPGRLDSWAARACWATLLLTSGSLSMALSW